MTKRKAVIFDLDGTLLDTLEDLAAAVNHILGTYGYPLRTKQQVRKALGNGLERLLRLSVPASIEETRFQQMLGEFKPYYFAHCNEKTGAYPGIPELLGSLQRQGVAMAIVSNKAQPAVTELCRQYFGAYMQVAIGESAGVKRKPAPDTVLKALEILDVAKEDAVYVGDSEVDKATADNVGMDCILVSWGFRDRALLDSLRAWKIVATPYEIEEVIKEDRR